MNSDREYELYLMLRRLFNYVKYDEKSYTKLDVFLLDNNSGKMKKVTGSIDYEFNKYLHEVNHRLKNNRRMKIKYYLREIVK